MIDEACIIAVNARIDHGSLVDREQERMIVAWIVAFVARIGGIMTDAVAQVLDDARAFANSRLRKATGPVNRRTLEQDQLRLGHVVAAFNPRLEYKLVHIYPS